MTDPREALERLTRWRDYGFFHDKSPYKGVQALDKQNAMNDDVVALLSLVEKQQDALNDLHEHYCQMMPDTRAFSERRVILHAWKAEHGQLLDSASLSSPTGGDRE